MSEGNDKTADEYKDARAGTSENRVHQGRSSTLSSDYQGSTPVTGAAAPDGGEWSRVKKGVEARVSGDNAVPPPGAEDAADEPAEPAKTSK